MKLIILACILAVAVCSEHQIPYHGPEHIPVIGPNGVPIDTPEVQIAKTLHMLYKAAAEVREKLSQHQDSHYRRRREIYPEEHHRQEYAGPQHYPIIGHDGVPVDTIEVQQARAEHFAHVAAAKALLQQQDYIDAGKYGGNEVGQYEEHSGHY